MSYVFMQLRSPIVFDISSPARLACCEGHPWPKAQTHDSIFWPLSDASSNDRNVRVTTRVVSFPCDSSVSPPLFSSRLRCIGQGIAQVLVSCYVLFIIVDMCVASSMLYSHPQKIKSHTSNGMRLLEMVTERQHIVSKGGIINQRGRFV